MNGKRAVKRNIATVIFAVFLFLGIWFLRFPVPGTEQAFFQLAHVIVMLGIICLGGMRTAFVTMAAFVLFELLQKDFAAIPFAVFSSLVSCLTVGVLYSTLDYQAEDGKKRWMAGVISALVYGALQILLSLAWNSWTTLKEGGKAVPALIRILPEVPLLLLNMLVTVLGVAILSIPVQAIYRWVMKEN
ncbi:MAG: hypothetical protein PUB88_06975 [Clostridium sp.]|nr:hypothetical protein [Clostridium sp.]